MTHPSMSLGVDIQMGTPTDLWVLGQSRLGEKTRLGSKGTAYIWVDIDCHLIEVSWSQGTSQAAPERVVPRPDAGSATLSLVDPDRLLLPSADPAVGLRPSRAIRIVDRADNKVLWAGVVERARFSLDPVDPLGPVTVECVDAVTLLQRAPEIRTPRAKETSKARVGWLIDTYRPGHPRTVDSAAVQQVAAILDGDQLPLWRALVDAADAESGWLWIRRDGRLELGSIGAIGRLPRTWAPPACGTVILEDIGQDLMAQPTRWDVTRRSSGSADVPVTQHTTDPEAVSAYGDWQATVDNHPGATDEEARQAATLAAAWWGPERMQLGTVRVDVTAGSGDPDMLPVLLALCRDTQLGDGLNLKDVQPIAPDGATMILGWNWTWSGAGGLAGVLTIAPVPDWGGMWSLGAVGASELDSTARLAKAAA